MIIMMLEAKLKFLLFGIIQFSLEYVFGPCNMLLFFGFGPYKFFFSFKMVLVIFFAFVILF